MAPGVYGGLYAHSIPWYSYESELSITRSILLESPGGWKASERGWEIARACAYGVCCAVEIEERDLEYVLYREELLDS